MAFVCKYLSRGDDAGTGPDAGGLGTGRDCGRMVDVGSFGGGGAGMTQLKGLRKLKSPGSAGSAALAAFVAQRAVSVVVLPSGNTET